MEKSGLMGVKGWCGRDRKGKDYQGNQQYAIEQALIMEYSAVECTIRAVKCSTVR
jgi:hypothetical protein